MIAIARFLNDCSGVSDYVCDTGCEPICTSPTYKSGRNGKFYACTATYLNSLHQKSSVYDHAGLLLFRQVKSLHRAPRDGFTLQIRNNNVTGSCPLTIHPMKGYDKAVVASFQDCEDVPLVYNQDN